MVKGRSVKPEPYTATVGPIGLELYMTRVSPIQLEPCRDGVVPVNPIRPELFTDRVRTIRQESYTTSVVSVVQLNQNHIGGG